MRDRVRQIFARMLMLWIALVQRHKISTVILCFGLVFLSVQYTVNNIGINTDTEDMLSPDLSWRKLDKQLTAEFPQFSGTILLVVEAPTPDQAMDASEKLYQRLQQETESVESIFSFRSLPFFKTSSLLYLENDELQDLSDRLAEIQPFLAKLTEDQNIRGLFNMLHSAITAKIDGEEVELSPLIIKLNEAFTAQAENKPYQLSWHSLMSGEDLDKSIYREFIFVKAKLDYSELFPAENILERIRTIGEELKINKDNNLRLRLTGSVALSHEELQSVMTGTEIAIVVAMCMVAAIMIIGLGSFWLVLATMITLSSGLLITAGWATFTVGELNLISVAFAVLYIGLGVDFAIHFCLRFREHLLKSKNKLLALSETSRNCGDSLFICALTTAIGFYAFMPTDYDGIAELGWISGSGMFISFFITMTLLPALLGLLPYSAETVEDEINTSKHFQKLFSFPVDYALAIKTISVLLVLVLIWYVPDVKFDHNTLNLQNPENESVKTYQDLLAESESSPWTAEILAKDEQEATELEERLLELPLVSEVTWLKHFIPEEQDEKLAIIEEMDLLLSGMSLTQELPSPDINDRFSAMEKLFLLMAAHPVEVHKIPHAAELMQHIEAFIKQYINLDENSQESQLLALEHRLLDSLPGRLASLETSLLAESVDRDSLPSSLVERWVGINGGYLMEIAPVENLQDNEALERFVVQLQSHFPNVIGSPVVSIEAGNAVVSAFQQAFFTALIVITILLLILMKRKRDAFLILIPILIAALLTAGLSLVFSIPLNFANIIALPLLLGIGVDSGIHIVHRYRNAAPGDNLILATSSARAVLVSALTTIVSIGNLAFSSHLGTASMGKLLTIGISMTLLCTLIILPGLLATTIKTTNENK